MKEAIGSVPLLSRATDTFETAQVFKGLDQKNFDDFEQLWKPLLNRSRASYSSWSAAAQAHAQDSHWDWIRVTKEALTSLQYEAFAVECKGATQGLMLVNLTRFAKLDIQKGLELVYVERIATAPWNRSALVPNPQFKGVGRILLATAISLSVQVEFQGRLGLHSLKQSETWYRDVCGMSDLGVDPEKNLRYFEMTVAQASPFLS